MKLPEFPLTFNSDELADYVLLQGDSLNLLKCLDAKSVNCCVTSPPYWGLRDYGTATWSGGDSECDHLEPPRGGRNPETAGKQLTNTGTLAYQYSNVCAKCGAVRVDSQLGLENTVEEFTDNLVDVFREVRRVLHDDGTVWLILGGSYAAKGVSGLDIQGASSTTGKANPRAKIKKSVPCGLKPKDLIGVPWRVAFALQADGWYLRSDIIWAKPNPMPESVRDRCTKAHEYIFLLSKSKRYYYDNAAIKEPLARPEAADGTRGFGGINKAGANIKHGNRTTGRAYNCKPVGGKNKRDVWVVPTRGYRGPHYATFPPKLIEPCVLAGCPKGGVVLDPFCGSGVTCFVSVNNGRNSIGIDLDTTIAEDRIRKSITGD